MSLINDALKRAREADQQRVDKAPPAPPLQPVDHTAPPNRAGWIVVIGLLVATLAFSVFYLSRWAWRAGTGPPAGSSNEMIASSSAPPREVAAPLARAAVEVGTNLVPRQASVAGSDSSAATVKPAPLEPQPVAVVAEPIPAEPPASPDQDAATTANAAPPEAARFPGLKLQSIVFRLRNPSVVIDSEMLGVGDTIKGARVVKIERHAVTLEWQGQTNVLRLPQF